MTRRLEPTERIRELAEQVCHLSTIDVLFFSDDAGDWRGNCIGIELSGGQLGQLTM